MSDDMMKISCVLIGDCAIDFERLSMVLKVGQYGMSRPKQQAAMIGAAMLVLDATQRAYAKETGKRYPSLAELLEFAGIARTDINKLVGVVDLPDESTIGSLATAVAKSGKNEAIADSADHSTAQEAERGAA